MSQTDQPPGSRPFCPVCGEHRWARVGYCLGPCAGNINDPDYPLTAPEEMKWNRAPEKKHVASNAKAAPKPPKKGRRARELQYEAMGQLAPWLEVQKPEGS